MRPVLRRRSGAEPGAFMSGRILVVDDDAHIREVVCFALEKAGFTTRVAKDGEEALRRFSEGGVDLVVLDVGLPEMDGLEVCRRIRRDSETPILFLSARDEEIDRILGLEMGGDDYVPKPFSPRELAARVNAILKRARRAPEPAKVEAALAQGELRLDPAGHVVTFKQELVPLTAHEFAILRLLMARPAHVVTRERIFEVVYEGRVHVSDRTIDSHVRNLRARLGQAGCADAVTTVHGVGFRLGRCEAAAS
jgi:two-component system OmpR family response regulator